MWHEKRTHLFRNLKFHDWLVTADHQTKLTLIFVWWSAVTNQSWNFKLQNKSVCFSCCNRSPQGHSWGLSTVCKEDFLVWLSKCVGSLTKTLKNAYLTVSIFKIFRGSMPPDPPRKARASPSQWSLRDHSLNHIISQVSRLQLSKSWQVW